MRMPLLPSGLWVHPMPVLRDGIWAHLMLPCMHTGWKQPLKFLTKFIFCHFKETF